MSVTVDALSGSHGAYPAGLATYTLSHTVGAGSNRLLVVNINAYNGDGVGGITGVTYAGNAMTILALDGTCGFSTWNRAMRAYYIVAPATGANNIVVTFGTVDGDAEVSGISMFGVDQTTPNANVVHYSLSDTGKAVTTVSGDMVLDLIYPESAGLGITLTDGGTYLTEGNGTGAPQTCHYSHYLAASGTSTTTGYSSAPNLNDWDNVAWAVKAAAADAAGVPYNRTPLFGPLLAQ